MPKSKARKLEQNVELRVALESLVGPGRVFGRYTGLAKDFGISDAYVSDFRHGYRGAGPEILRGLAKYKPLLVLQALEIDPRAIVALWKDSGEGLEGGEQGMADLPDSLRRATVAAVELLQCTADEAIRVAVALAEENQGRPDEDPDWWLLQIRDRVPKRKASGVRRKRTSGGI